MGPDDVMTRSSCLNEDISCLGDDNSCWNTPGAPDIVVIKRRRRRNNVGNAGKHVLSTRSRGVGGGVEERVVVVSQSAKGQVKPNVIPCPLAFSLVAGTPPTPTSVVRRKSCWLKKHEARWLKPKNFGTAHSGFSLPTQGSAGFALGNVASYLKPFCSWRDGAYRRVHKAAGSSARPARPASETVPAETAGDGLAALVGYGSDEDGSGSAEDGWFRKKRGWRSLKRKRERETAQLGSAKF